MSILVTGGAGYIGSHCIKILLEHGYDVVCLDNLSTGHKAAIDSRCKCYFGDIRNYSFLDNIFKNEKIEAVIHFCAMSLVGESMIKPLEYFDNNVGGTLTLLKAMQMHKINKIVFSSSAAVYGSQEKMPLTETSPTLPTNPYGETKLAIEKLLKWADNAYGIKYLSLRYFNVAGALATGELGEVHKPETHLIPLILETVLGKREKISVFGNDYNTFDGTCIRDYIHVVDLIDAHILALNHLFLGNESNIFNLGSGKGYSVMEVINTCMEVTKKKIAYEIIKRRAGDPDKLITSNRKIKKSLGWEPKLSLKDMISSAYQFHKNHINGY